MTLAVIHSCIRFLFLLSVFAIHHHIAEGCVCMFSSYNVQRSYHEKDSVMKVKVLGRVLDGKKKDPSRRRIHVAKVLKDYKGKTNKGKIILIQSQWDTCGVKMTKGNWLVSMDYDPKQDLYSTMLCDFTRKYSLVQKEEKDFLNSRMICDENGQSCTCADGSEILNCFIDPCETSKCDQGTCKGNYCAGCKAEWMDDSGIFTC